jgi:excisionase family DNA binding protein
MPQPVLAYTIAECADALKVSQRSIRRAIAAGRLNVMRWGRIVRVPTESLQRFVEEAAQTKSQEAKEDNSPKSTTRTNGGTDVRNSKEYACETQERRP